MSSGYNFADGRASIETQTPQVRSFMDAEDEGGHYPSFNPDELARSAFNAKQQLPVAGENNTAHDEPYTEEQEWREPTPEGQEDPDLGWTDLSQGIDLSGLSLSEFNQAEIGYKESTHSVEMSDDASPLINASQQPVPEEPAQVINDEVMEPDDVRLPTRKNEGGFFSRFKKQPKNTTDATLSVELPQQEESQTQSKKKPNTEKALPPNISNSSHSAKELGGDYDDNNNNNNNYERSDSKLSALVVGLSLVLSITSVSASFYAVLKNSNAADEKQVKDIRVDLIAKIDKIEAEALGSSAALTDQLKELSTTLSTLSHKLAQIDREVDDLKSLSDKMASDNDLSLTWARQTRDLVDEAKKSILVNESAISELRTKIDDTQRGIKRTLETRQAAARKEAVLAKKSQGPVTELMGYKLFSIDDWGGILLVTLTKGEDVKRVRVGDTVEDWRIQSVDQQEVKIILTKGSDTKTLVSSGG